MFCFFVATVPDEQAEAGLLTYRHLGQQDMFAGLSEPKRFIGGSWSDKGGNLLLASRDIWARLAPFGDSIALSAERLVEPDADKLKKLSYTLSLRGRDLRRAWIAYCDMRKADLDGADLRNVTLVKVDLREANLSNADLSGASLGYVDLRGTRLTDAKLIKVLMLHVDLSGASLDDTDLTETDLTETDLCGATLNGADLSKAHLSQQQLDKACGDDQTRLPEGLTIKHCAKPDASSSQ